MCKFEPQELIWLMVFVRAVLFLGFPIGLISLALWTDLPHVRYAGEPCQGKILFERVGPVDLVVLGSSRSMRSFNAYDFKEALGASGKDRSVYDISRSYRDLGHSYVYVRDLLQQKRVRNILIEYNSSFEGEAAYHRLFHLKTRLRDLIEHFWAEPSKFAVERFGRIARWTLRRLVDRFDLWWNNKVPAPFNIRSARASTLDCTNHDAGYFPEEMLKVEKKNKGNYFHQYSDWDLRSTQEERAGFYIRKILKLAREHQTRVQFFFIPTRYNTRISSSFQKDFQRYFSAPLLNPSDSELRSWFADSRFYIDSSHMSFHGQKVFSKWLAQNLKLN